MPPDFAVKRKNPFRSGPEGNIFERELRQLVELQGHAALLPGSGILVQKTLVHSLVHGLDGSLVRCVSRLAITFKDSGVELLDIGLEGRLASLVSGIGDLGKLDSLLGGLNVGHGYTSLIRNRGTDRPMQCSIILFLFHKINSFFAKIEKIFQHPGKVPRKRKTELWLSLLLSKYAAEAITERNGASEN